MIQVLWIPGRLPGLNELLDAHGAGAGGRGNHYARIKKKWTADVALLARVAKLQPVRRAWLRFEWRETNRRRNTDNFAAGGRKIILDGLVKARVLVNDGWDEIAGFEDVWLVAAPPGVIVTIESVV